MNPAHVNWRHTRLIVLITLLFCVGVSLFQLPNVKFNYDFEAFFPEGDAELDFFLKFRDNFEPDDNLVLIGIDGPQGLMDTTFLSEMEQLEAEMLALPHVATCFSPLSLKRPRKFAGRFIPVPALRAKRPDSGDIHHPLLKGRLVSADGRALAMMLKMDTILDQAECEEFSGALDSLLLASGYPDAHIAGRPVYQALFVELEKREFVLYAALSTLFVFLSMVVLYRKAFTVGVAVISVLLCMLVFVGHIALRGMELDIMSSLYPILMIIVGMSDVVHISTRYLDELAAGNGRQMALRKSIREVGLATFLTSVTTAIGFASLYAINIPPIRNFGLTAAIGVFIAYLVVMASTPTLLSLFPQHRLIPKRNRPQEHILKVLLRWYAFGKKNPRKVTLGALVVVLFSVLGMMQISTNTFVETHFPNRDRAKRDFQFFEQRFDGFATFEIGILAGEGLRVMDRDILQATADLEDHLSSRFGHALGSFASPTVIPRLLQHADNGEFRLPQSEEEWRLVEPAMKLLPQGSTEQILSKDGRFGRISFKVFDIGSRKRDSIRHEIQDWAGANPVEGVAFRSTGTIHLLDNNNGRVREFMIKGLGGAFLLVSLIMMILFRSWKMLIVSLIPNVVPLLVVAGVMGWLGIELDAPTSIIFAIAFGIAVDDTIHFLSKYRILMSQGVAREPALFQTFRETGKSIVITTLVLFFGFFLLVTSAYPPTTIVGLFVGITLVTAVVCDLMLIPLLIRTLYRNKI